MSIFLLLEECYARGNTGCKTPALATIIDFEVGELSLIPRDKIFQKINYHFLGKVCYNIIENNIFLYYFPISKNHSSIVFFIKSVSKNHLSIMFYTHYISPPVSKNHSSIVFLIKFVSL